MHSASASPSHPTSSRRRRRGPVRLAVLAATALMAIVAMALPAAAQGTSQVSVIHGIPGVTVDVYVNGTLTLEDFQPKDVAGPLSLPAGDYDIAIFAANADPDADTAVINVEGAAVPAGADISLIAHLDASGDPTLGVFVNDVSKTDAGDGRVTIRHTAAAPAVDIVLDGAAVAGLTNLSNGGEGVVDLPAASYPTGIAATGTTDVLFDAPVTVAEGRNLIVYAIGDLSGGTFDLAVQTIDGLHNAPGRVDTGTSGLATTSQAPTMLIAALALAGIAGASASIRTLARR